MNYAPITSNSEQNVEQSNIDNIQRKSLKQDNLLTSFGFTELQDKEDLTSNYSKQIVRNPKELKNYKANLLVIPNESEL